MIDMSDKSRFTHFGFKDVPWEEKQQKVADVFHSVAGSYDVMNDTMSMGLHRLWKRRAIQLTGVRTGQTVLDLASGTGDLAKQMAALVGPTGKVVFSDINASMLAEGRARMESQGLIGNIRYAQINAENIPFPDDTFDCVTIGFGLRNVTDKQKALNEMCRVIKPGGRVLILEFSQVTIPGLKPIYDAYSFHLLPKMGKWIAKDEDSYRYLAESIRKHPDQQTLKGMMTDAGLEDAEFFNLNGGIVAIHRGFKYQ